MMKRIFLTPIAIAMLAFTVNCTSSNENSRSTSEMDRSGNMETTEGSVLDTEQASNLDVRYNDLFDEVSDTEDHDVLSLARMEDDLSTFVNLLEQSGLEASLQNLEDGFTLFIPTNEAFADLPQETVQFLTDPRNRSELARVIQAHVIPTEVSTLQFTNNHQIETADGQMIPVSTEGRRPYINIGGANIVRPDVAASNGTIHVVDAIIQPTESPAGMGTN